MSGEADGLPLGLPLPPVAGKKRIAVVMGHDAILATMPPPLLTAAVGVAPESWRPTTDSVAASALRCGVEARVFGSLAWRLLTGLDYLTDGSDLDLLLPFSRETDIARLMASLAAIEAGAPMRLDGELVREDGAAVNWREIHAGARELLVKSPSGVALLGADDFLDGGDRS